MKLVLSPDQVAHKWANQLQDEARNSGNTLFFDHSSIYSYGRHFCIAKHVTNESGERAILFTTRGYSVTTRKHIGIVRNASSHLKKIYCFDPADSIAHNIEAFESQIKNELAGLVKAKKPEKYINVALSTLAEAKEYAAFFEIELPARIIDLVESAQTGKYKEYLIKEAEVIAEKAHARQENEKIIFKKDLAKGRKGTWSRLSNRPFDRDYLRLNKKGRIETSQGVEIIKPIATLAYKVIINSIKNGGCETKENCNFKILEYNVSEVNKDFIRVGCHTIDMKEINKMAKQIGII